MSAQDDKPTLIGSFARYLIQKHIDRLFATMSRESARHIAQRMITQDLPEFELDGFQSYDIHCWDWQNSTDDDRRTPYLTMSTIDDSEQHAIYGIFRPAKGIFLSCEALRIDYDTFPQAVISSMQERSIAEHQTESSANHYTLSQLIDLTIPDYDPKVIGYTTTDFGDSEDLNLTLENDFIPWNDFLETMEKAIATRRGKDFD